MEAHLWANPKLNEGTLPITALKKGTKVSSFNLQSQCEIYINSKTLLHAILNAINDSLLFEWCFYITEVSNKNTSQRYNEPEQKGSLPWLCPCQWVKNRRCLPCYFSWPHVKLPLSPNGNYLMKKLNLRFDQKWMNVVGNHTEKTILRNIWA